MEESDRVTSNPEKTEETLGLVAGVAQASQFGEDSSAVQCI